MTKLRRMASEFQNPQPQEDRRRGYLEGVLLARAAPCLLLLFIRDKEGVARKQDVGVRAILLEQDVLRMVIDYPIVRESVLLCDDALRITQPAKRRLASEQFLRLAFELIEIG